MKSFALTIISMVLVVSGIYSQTYDRRYDPKYLWTSLNENFSAPRLDRSVWGTTIHFKRNLGFLIDSPKTIRIKKGNLELKMRYAHSYLDSLWTSKGWKHDHPNYIGGEIVTKNKYHYGIFECRANYALKSAEKIQYFINDHLMHEVINHNYEWFPSVPLNLILSQQVTQGQDALGIINPITPQTSYFDWVKVRQFFLAPQITCPDAITSEGTVTLDVDSLASNITWKLTPSEQFITSEGSGNTAHITRATNSTGPGKITYTFQMPSGENFTSEKTFK